MHNTTMNDLDIRKSLLERFISRRLFDISSVLEEVSVSNGCARADIVVTSKKLECFEIKSEFDSLKRLTQQGWHYSRSFDQVTLVAATKHLDKALNCVPLWWGIIEVSKDDKLTQRRKPGNNPNITPHGLAELLNREESIALLAVHGVEKGITRLSNTNISDKISKIVGVKELSAFVLSAFNDRQARRKDSYPLQFPLTSATC
jgi:hypothetical protein